MIFSLILFLLGIFKYLRQLDEADICEECVANLKYSTKSIWSFEKRNNYGSSSIQDRGRAKRPPYQFFPQVTSTDVGVSPKNFLTFSFNHFATRRISRSYLVPVPNYWTWIKTTPQKKWFFWSNPYKIDVMITSLIEILE